MLSRRCNQNSADQKKKNEDFSHATQFTNKCVCPIQAVFWLEWSFLFCQSINTRRGRAQPPPCPSTPAAPLLAVVLRCPPADTARFPTGRTQHFPDGKE